MLVGGEGLFWVMLGLPCASIICHFETGGPGRGGVSVSHIPLIILKNIPYP